VGEEQREGRWADNPRVRIRTRVVRRDDSTRPTTDLLRGGLRDAERRFLWLQSRVAEGALPDALSGYLVTLSDLRMIGDRLRDMSGRRDLSYLADRRLTALGNYCVWLVRRVSAEFLLLQQIHLEQELKRLISADAYRMYLRLEDVADTARELEMLDDRSLMTRLREGSMRETLEQVLSGEAFPWGQQSGAAAETSEQGGPSG
jgi:hypothetical protein